MADQRFDSHQGLFWLDLHGCKTSEARHALTLRLNECHAYGIDKLVVVHGTPQQFVGSLAEAVVDIVERHPRVSNDCTSFVRINAQLLRTAATKVTVASNLTPLPQDEAMSFAPISSSYETRADRLSRCTSVFRPFEIWYPLSRLQVHFGSTIPAGMMQDCLRDIADKDRGSDESGQISVKATAFYRMLGRLTGMLKPNRRLAPPSEELVVKVSNETATHLHLHALSRWGRRMSSAFEEFAEGNFRGVLRPLYAALGCLESDEDFFRHLTLLNLALAHYRLEDYDEALGQLRQIPSENIDAQLRAFILECEADVYETQARYADAAHSLSSIDEHHLTIQVRERLLLLGALTGDDSINLEMIEESVAWESPFATTHLLLEVSQDNPGVHTEVRFRLLKLALTRLERLLGRFDPALLPILNSLRTLATSVGDHESNVLYLERVDSIKAQQKWLDAEVPVLQMFGRVLDDLSLTFGSGDSEVASNAPHEAGIRQADAKLSRLRQEGRSGLELLPMIQRTATAFLDNLMLDRAVALADEGLKVLETFSPQDGKTEAELLKVRITAHVQISGRSASVSADIARADSLLLDILTRTDNELNNDEVDRLAGVIGPEIRSLWKASDTAAELAEDALNTRLYCATLLADIRLLDAKSHLAMGELKQAHRAGAAAGELISGFFSEIAPRGEVTAVYVDELRRVLTSVLSIRALTQARSGAFAESTALLHLAKMSPFREATRGDVEDGFDRILLEAFVLSNDLPGARAFFSSKIERFSEAKDGHYFSAVLCAVEVDLRSGHSVQASSRLRRLRSAMSSRYPPQSAFVLRATVCAAEASLRNKEFSEAQKLSRLVLKNQWNFPDPLLLAWAGAILAESSKTLGEKDGYERGKAAFSRNWAAQNPERQFFATEGFDDELLQMSLRLGTNPMLFLATLSREITHLDLTALALKACRLR